MGVAGLEPTMSFKTTVLQTVAIATMRYSQFSPQWDSKWVVNSVFYFLKTCGASPMKTSNTTGRICVVILYSHEPAYHCPDWASPLLNESWTKDCWVSLTHCCVGQIRTGGVSRHRVMSPAGFQLPTTTRYVIRQGFEPQLTDSKSVVLNRYTIGQFSGASSFDYPHLLRYPKVRGFTEHHLQRVRDSNPRNLSVQQFSRLPL